MSRQGVDDSQAMDAVLKRFSKPTTAPSTSIDGVNTPVVAADPDFVELKDELEN